jgi:hypothetical protein
MDFYSTLFLSLLQVASHVKNYHFNSNLIVNGWFPLSAFFCCLAQWLFYLCCCVGFVLFFLVFGLLWGFLQVGF